MASKYILPYLLIVLTFFTSSAQRVSSIKSIVSDAVVIIERSGNGDVWTGSVSGGAAFYQASVQQWSYFNETNYPGLIPSDSITSITYTQISDSNIAFIGTRNGLYFVRNGNVDTVPVLADRHIAGLVYRPDSILVLSKGRVTWYDSTHTFKSSFPTPIQQITTGQFGGPNCHGLWAGTADSGCFGTSDCVNFSYIDTSGLHGHLVDNRVNVVARDPNCASRLCGTKGGFSRCPVGGPPCQNYTTANGLPENDITCIDVDCLGRIWLGTRDSGIAIMVDSGIFLRVTTANGLPSNHITAISFGGDTSCSALVGSADGNITEVDSASNVVQILSSIQPTTDEPLRVYVFPQPAGDQIMFMLANNVVVGDFYLSSLNGQMLHHTSLKDCTKFSLDVSNYANGVYFYQIYSGGVPVKNGKLVVAR